MSARRQKSKPQVPRMNKQLATAEAEILSNQMMSNRKKKLRVFKFELGKFLVDVAKLVFAGVIIAGIMDEEINRLLLFSVGSLIVVLFSLLGLYIISNNKEEL